jgi:hypothetical protein
MKKFLSLLLFMSVFASHTFAYSYASAGKEPTLDAEDGILNAINENDFVKAQAVFDTYAKNYQYLNDDFNDKLYEGLQSAITNKDKQAIIKWLRVSLAVEIQRRLDGGLKNINNFNISKVMLAKANKFYKLLSSNLDAKTNKALKKALKECTTAIGNPGLFGVGAKPVDVQAYKQSYDKAVKLLKSL